MFIAMNRFHITLGHEQEFIDIWANRKSYLDDVPGFVRFTLLRGSVTDEYALFSSHAEWDSRQVFEDWTHSEAFRKAHAGARAGASKDLYEGRPNLELFESVL